MIDSAFFVLGLVVGSFLNVVIHRIPQGESLLYPPSQCSRCGHLLRWFELIPIISFCLQRGKCRQCGGKITVQYPLIELLTSIIYLILYIYYGLVTPLIVSLIFISILVPITIIDIKHQVIPDSLNIAGAIMGIITIVITDGSPWSGFTGALLGGTIMLLIAIVSRGGMGGGDIKMVAWMGLFLGWKLTLLALFLSFVIGGLGSLFLILGGIKKRKDFIPFGPFLAIGGFTAYMFGNEILRWYFQTF